MTDQSDFLVLNQVTDYAIARRIVDLHSRIEDSIDRVYSLDDIRRYLLFARQFKPKVTCPFVLKESTVGIFKRCLTKRVILGKNEHVFGFFSPQLFCLPFFRTVISFREVKGNFFTCLNNSISFTCQLLIKIFYG